MQLNIRRRFRRPRIENRAFHYFGIDSGLLFILLLNCFAGIAALLYTVFYHEEFINTKCYFRIFCPIIFVLQFIPIFWMFGNDSPKAAFIALYCEILGTVALIAVNLAYCSVDWKYESLVLYFPRILSLYVYFKALVFYTHQEHMVMLNGHDNDTSSDEE